MLLAAVLQALPSETRPPVLAAGGITVGSQIASVLAMGADGAVVGTRFLFAHECMYSDSQKAAMLEAKMTDTVRGLAFDDVNRTNFWPKGVDGRGLRNHIWKDWEDGVELDERLKRYDEGKDKGEKERLLIWVGVGVGMVRELSPSAVCVCSFPVESPS
jgi:nitronate monooxygenase